MFSFFKKIRIAFRYLPTLLSVKRRVYGTIDACNTLYWLESVEKRLQAQQDKVVLYFEKEAITAQQLLARSYQITRWAEKNSLKQGDTVGVCLHNCPLFVPLIMGLSRIGVRCALLNTDVTGKALWHTIELSGARMVVVDEDSVKSMNTLSDTVRRSIELVHASGRYERMGDFEAELSVLQDTPVQGPQGFAKKEVSLYIYTSGSTGLPKAVKMSQTKLSIGIKATSTLIEKRGVNTQDRVYIALPLFHSTGLIVGLFPALNVGASVVIARRFSPSHFFEEAVNTKATVVYYIGELFRYLVNTPECVWDKKHTIRLAVGNGLRPDVWPKVHERFGIKDVIEFYAATEGNVIFFNLDNTIGSVGWLHHALFNKNGGHLLKMQEDNKTPVRTEDGFCVEAEVGQVGELIGRIPKTEASQGSFDGYTDQEATDKKILRDVFEKGDQYFRTGDLLRYDADHYFYFVDRVGDTFRWKGHNVATLEVAELLTQHAQVREALVYGVALPGYEGKAGMAVIVPGVESMDAKTLGEVVSQSGLAEYQRPKFIRVVGKIDKTATKKYQRQRWAEQGYAVLNKEDHVYYYDYKQHAYLQLDAKTVEGIHNGSIEIH